MKRGAQGGKVAFLGWELGFSTELNRIEHLARFHFFIQEGQGGWLRSTRYFLYFFIACHCRG
jgi:hypothetical protein